MIDIYYIYIYISTDKNVENKTKILYNNTRNKWKRDVAQLGSAFVLGTKCHGFKSCHPYQITFPMRSKKEEFNFN